MKRSRMHALLLAFGLVFTQAVAFAHAFDHPAFAQIGDQCTFCAHGHGLDHIPAAHTPVPASAPAERFTPVAAYTLALKTRRSAFRSRAPPASH